MTLEILICTVEEHLSRIFPMLLPESEGINYLVSCQYLENQPLLPDDLASRRDVRVIWQKGRGLSINRNNALRHAVNDILLVADDDEVFYPEGLAKIVETYAQNPDVDIALFKVNGMGKRYPEHPFRFQQKNFSGAYSTASVEMTMRRRAVEDMSFNTHFGLGSDYLAAGEEQVFLYDALEKGLNVSWFPVEIAETGPVTTGQRFLTDERVQRSKGATFCYLFGKRKAQMMCLKEALHYLVYKQVNPIKLMRNMNQGIDYAANCLKCQK